MGGDITQTKESVEITRSASRSGAIPLYVIWLGYLAAATNWLLSLSLFFRSGPLVPGGTAFFLYIIGLIWTLSMRVSSSLELVADT